MEMVMSHITKEFIIGIIKEAVVEYAKENDIPNLMDPEPNTRLYGSSGGLDSLGLVVLIGELEERIDDEFDMQITLADEKAMSQTVSPFRSIQSLAHYIYKLINYEA